MSDAVDYFFDEFAKTLGYVTIKYSDAQLYVLKIFVAVSGMEPSVAKAVFFSLKSDNAQRELTIAVAKEVMDAETDECKQVVAAISNLSRLSGERNAAIHTMWTIDDDGEGGSMIAPSFDAIPHRSLKDMNAQKQFEALHDELDTAKDTLFMAFLRILSLTHGIKEVIE